MGAHVLGSARLSQVLRGTPGGATTIGALLAAALGAVAFADIAEDYLTNDPLARWDASLAQWLADHRSPAGIDVFRAITFFGSTIALIAIAGAVAVVLLSRRRLAEAWLLVLVLAVTDAMNVLLKHAFHRPRPEVAFIHLNTYSFPSGHAMLSTAVYGALAFLAWRPGRRGLVVLATVVVVSAIAFSRIYLGVHYLSDVLGGIAAGITCMGLVVALYAAQGPRFAAWLTTSRT